MSTERSDRSRRPTRAGRGGQVLIFLVVVLTILAFAVLWNLDLGHVVHLRIRSQNAADAAALAAAGWQGRSLNAVGELNLLMVSAAMVTDIPPGLDDGLSSGEVRRSLAQMQARILLFGPLLGLEAAQQAARNNGIHNNDGFGSMLLEHAQRVRDDYAQWLPGDLEGFEEWVPAYAEALSAVAGSGIAAAPRNSRFFRGSLLFDRSIAGEYLGNRGFYYAVAARDWCYLERLLYEDYRDHTFWGAARIDESLEPGSEILPLGIRFAGFGETWGSLGPAVRERLEDRMEEFLDDRRSDFIQGFPQFLSDFRCAVYATDGGPVRWGAWGPTHPNPVGQAALAAPPRREYDYSGCDAVFEVSVSPEIGMVGGRGAGATGWIPGAFRRDAEDSMAALRDFSEGAQVTASAAAKAIGSLGRGSRKIPPHALGLVLPAFERVALIPLAYATSGDSLDAAWREHLLEHVPAYLAAGPGALDPDCWYCRQLERWEDPAFREEGRQWHEAVDPATGERLHHCPPAGGGPGPGYGGFPIVH